MPVRRRELIGLVTAVDAPTPRRGGAGTCSAAPDPEPAFPQGLLATAEWIAATTARRIGLTLKSILPAGMWGESQVIVVAVGMVARPGGVAGEVLAWLERKRWGSGGLRRGAGPQASALGCNRPADPSRRGDAPDCSRPTPARAGHGAGALPGRGAAHPARAGPLFKRPPRQRQLYETLEALGRKRAGPAPRRTSSASARPSQGAGEARLCARSGR